MLQALLYWGTMIKSYDLLQVSMPQLLLLIYHPICIDEVYDVYEFYESDRDTGVEIDFVYTLCMPFRKKYKICIGRRDDYH